MDITVDELLKGKPTTIGRRSYYGTAAYVEPFLERLQKYTSDFRVHVQLPTQLTVSDSVQDITYNRVYIEAVMDADNLYKNHQHVIGMVMGLDVRKPVAKFYSGSLNSACTNLCVFSPEYLEIQTIKPEEPLTFQPLERILTLQDKTKEMLEKMATTVVTNSKENQENMLGKWCRNAMHKSYDFGYQPVKISVDNVVSAYKDLYEDEKSPYYQVSKETNMFDVYNAFTQQLTNARDKGKDLINMFEKTALIRDIIEV